MPTKGSSMKDKNTKSVHALLLFFGANLLLLLINAPSWTYLITVAVILWWIMRWERDDGE